MFDENLVLTSLIKDQTNHLNNVLKCKHCFYVFDNTQQLDEHLDSKNGTCVTQPIDCTFNSIGCKYNNLNRETLALHLFEYSNLHLNLMHRLVSFKAISKFSL